ncbi:MAG: Rieske (2Fe-2S) protein [Ignavibacteria bacterium]
MDRRSFIKVCGGTAALAGLQTTYLETVQAAEAKSFARVKLVDAEGNALKAAKLASDEAYIFHYPYKSTPCFLISLGAKAPGMKLQSDDGEYEWKGGVGPGGALVSYSAICAHQLSYPTKEHSPISYTGGTMSKLAGSAGKIVCCEHDRVYDPAQGGKMVVTTKEATQPLAAIVIEHDAATDEIYATGVAGGLLYDEFFRSYKRALMAEYGPGGAREEVKETAATLPMSKYVGGTDRC